MSANRSDAFDEIVDAFDERGGDFHTAWLAARQKFDHAWGRGNYNVASIGWLAWAEIDRDEQNLTINQLFHDYFVAIHHEEREEQLTEAATRGKTYLEGWEPSTLGDSLTTVADPTDEDAEVIVNAHALRNVLAELELAQHRLAMLTAEREGTS